MVNEDVFSLEDAITYENPIQYKAAIPYGKFIPYKDSIFFTKGIKHQENSIKPVANQELTGNLFDIADTVVHIPPYLAFSSQPLRVVRNNEVHELVPGNSLKPGDVIETCARHFALIAFPPGGNLILFPSSQLMYSGDAESLILKDAEILFENSSHPLNDDSSITNIPEKLYCFEHELSHYGTTQYPVSFAVSCRGDTGMILTAQKASLTWKCARIDCKVEQNTGIVVQAASVTYTAINLPDRPEIKKVSGITGESSLDEIIEISGLTILEWTPVAMADHYLVHLYEIAGDSLEHLQIIRSHTNHHEIDQLPAGLYAFRVMAIDYYGVTGSWSETLLFRLIKTEADSE